MRPSRKQMQAELYYNSECRVNVTYHHQRFELCSRLHIQFKGRLASMPSLKNNKIPGTNFKNPKTSAQLRAMTDLYNDALISINAPHRPVFCDIRAFMVVILGKGKADEDNALAAVKDWCEPFHMRGKSRGFGIGVVDNDKNLNGVCVYAKSLGRVQDHTDIVLVQYDRINDGLTDIITRANV